MKPAPSPAAERQRRYRERKREGRWVVQLKIWPDLIDALESAGFAPAGIESREDSLAALRAFLQRWEASMNRLRPAGSITHNGGGVEPVVDHSNQGSDDHDAEDDL